MSLTYQTLSWTLFPDALDDFPKFSDITTTEDAQLVEQIQNFILNEDMESALEILINNPQLETKLFDANKFNSMSDAIKALERFYKLDILPYIEQKQELWQKIMDRFNYKGDYRNTIQYEINNLIDFTASNGKSLYICINRPPIGTQPTNLGFFRVITIKGKQGISGGNFNFRFAWVSDEEYGKNDVVVHNGNWWGSLSENTNKEPIDNSAFWIKILETPTPKIYQVTYTKPNNLPINEFWFKIGKVIDSDY